jgi:hypothetical protein
MKELFNFPQKKGKNYVSSFNSKVLIELNEVKIKNFSILNDKNGYIFECIIPHCNNQENIEKIKELDIQAKDTIITNYNDWFDNNDNDDDNDNDNNNNNDNDNDNDKTEEFINSIYINSYDSDRAITLILSSKISSEIIINDEEKEYYELIEFLNENKKNKNMIINIDIIFLGIYINKTSIINKWAIKYVNIETIKEDDGIEWNRKEIEEEWKFDLINYEEETNIKIKELTQKLKTAKELYLEILKESNIKNWENKLIKLKTIIF